MGFLCPSQAENFGSCLPAAGGKFWDFSARHRRKILTLFCLTQAENLLVFSTRRRRKILRLLCPPHAENFGSFLPATGGKFWGFLNYRELYKVLYCGVVYFWGCCLSVVKGVLYAFGGVV